MCKIFIQMLMLMGLGLPSSSLIYIEQGYIFPSIRH